jgi:hypothetical protein
MSRFTLAAIVAVALSVAACDSSTTAPTTATTPTVTDTFTGTLNLNGASSFAFSVSAAGYVYATLTSVADSDTNLADTTATVGMSLGTWNGTGCTVILSNDQAVQGTMVTGSVTGIGNLCARVYDVGKVVTPLSYQITVIHP